MTEKLFICEKNKKEGYKRQNVYGHTLIILCKSRYEG